VACRSVVTATVAIVLADLAIPDLGTRSKKSRPRKITCDVDRRCRIVSHLQRIFCGFSADFWPIREAS